MHCFSDVGKKLIKLKDKTISLWKNRVSHICGKTRGCVWFLYRHVAHARKGLGGRSVLRIRVIVRMFWFYLKCEHFSGSLGVSWTCRSWVLYCIFVLVLVNTLMHKFSSAFSYVRSLTDTCYCLISLKEKESRWLGMETTSLKWCSRQVSLLCQGSGTDRIGKLWQICCPYNFPT